MFRALLCSSSGGSIVYVQHLLPSFSMSGRTAAHRKWR